MFIIKAHQCFALLILADLRESHSLMVFEELRYSIRSPYCCDLLLGTINAVTS